MGLRWAARSVEHLNELTADLQLTILRWDGHYRYRLGSYDEARTILERAVQAARASGAGVHLANCLNDLGNVLYSLGEVDASRGCHEEALRLRTGRDSWGEVSSLINLGYLEVDQERYAAAREVLERAFRLSEAMGEWRGRAFILFCLGVLEVEAGDADSAVRLLNRSVEISTELQDAWILGYAHYGLGLAWLRSRKPGTAREHLLRSWHARKTLGSRRGMAETADGFAHLLARTGHYLEATEIVGFAEAMRAGISAPRSPRESRRWEALLQLCAAHITDRSMSSMSAIGRTLAADEMEARVMAVGTPHDRDMD
jgi:tetratricopeptide (TPR) repeat protein